METENEDWSESLLVLVLWDGNRDTNRDYVAKCVSVRVCVRVCECACERERESCKEREKEAKRKRVAPFLTLVFHCGESEGQLATGVHSPKDNVRNCVARLLAWHEVHENGSHVLWMGKHAQSTPTARPAHTYTSKGTLTHA